MFYLFIVTWALVLLWGTLALGYQACAHFQNDSKLRSSELADNLEDAPSTSPDQNSFEKLFAADFPENQDHILETWYRRLTNEPLKIIYRIPVWVWMALGSATLVTLASVALVRSDTIRPVRYNRSIDY